MISIKVLLKRYFSIANLFIVKFASMALKYLITLYLSVNILDVADFGMFSLYLVLLNFVYLFIGFGVIDTGMYLISRDDDENLIGALLSITLIICIIFALILALVLKYYGFENYLLISILSSGYVLHLYVKKISIAKHNKFSMYYFELLIYLIAFILIVMIGKNIFTSILIYSASMLIISLVFVIYLKPSFKISIKEIRYLTANIKSYGLRVHFSQFIAMGTYDLDKLMLEYLYGFSSVGIYNLSLNFIMPVKLFSMSISEMMFRDFTKQKKIKKEVFIINSIFSIVVSCILSVTGYSIVLNFYSKEYHEIFNYIFFLPILAFLSSFYVPINNFFSAKGLAKQKFLNAVILAIFNVLFNILFIPSYGIIGAIIATILALTVNNFMFILQYKKYINITT